MLRLSLQAFIDQSCYCRCFLSPTVYCSSMISVKVPVTGDVQASLVLGICVTLYHDPVCFKLTIGVLVNPISHCPRLCCSQSHLPVGCHCYRELHVASGLLPNIASLHLPCGAIPRIHSQSAHH